MQPPLFRLNPVVDLHWVHWNDEYVIFDQASGQTHQLDPLRAFVVSALVESPQDVPALVAGLAAFPAFGDSPDLPGMLSDLLAEMVTTGLVETQAL